MSYLLETRKIGKTYTIGENSFNVLKDIDLKIERGDFIAIMGPSGSGKSTLMNILGLLDIPSTGDYLLLNQRVESLSEDELALVRRKTIGFIFQQFHLLPRTTSLDNVALPLFYSEGKLSHTKSAALLDKVGLAQRTLHKTHELSGGQQQRVAIARSLINNPQIIFADEPTGNLDSHSEKEILELLRSLNDEGITVIMVTHEEEIGQQARRLIRMKDGSIISDERLRELPQLSFERTGAPTQGAEGQAIKIPLGEDLKQGLKSLFSNKIRSALSMLGILIGVSSVITMLAIGSGAAKAIEDQLSSLGSNLLTLRPGGRGPGGISTGGASPIRLSPQDSQAIKNELQHIAAVSAMVRSNVQATRENKNWNTSLIGVEADYEEIQSATPALGRFFNAENGRKRERLAIIGQTVWKELFGNEDPIGQYIKVNRQNFQIIGVLPQKGGASWRGDPDDQIIVPLETAMRRVLGVDHVNEISIQISDKEKMIQMEGEIEQLMYSRHRVPPSQQDSAFRINNMAEIQEAISSSNKTMGILLAVVASVSLLVGGIGIMNIMLVSVTERTREIGLRKAIGATRIDIMRQFLIESVVITAIGGCIGIFLGVSFSYGLSLFANWPTSISPWVCLGAFLFSSGVGVIFGLYPARKAAYLNPIDSLRYD